MAIRRFLNLLFESKDPDHFILVWTLRNHRSAWFKSIDEAATYIADNKEQDLYVGAGLADKDNGRSQRATEEEVVALSGLFVDVDFVPVKGKVRPSNSDALELIRTMPLFPTMIVHTGHGYHGWWLFKEPYLIETPEERAHIKAISRAWCMLLKDRAAARGWDIDSVFDLARVMRCPGTMNCKDPKERVEARIVSEEPGARLVSPDDVIQFLPFGWDERGARNDDRPRASIVLNALAEPPFAKYDALRNNDDKFRLACDRKRNDLRDSSASGYDMSLACIAVLAGWTDQEIADLLVAMRRKANDDLKLNRVDYYERTISNARDTVSQTAALDALATTQAGDKDAKKRLCDALGIPIQRIVVYPSENGSVYYLIANGKHVPVGSIDALMNQRTFLNRVAETTGIVKPPIKSQHWWSVAQLILNMAEEDSFGMEGSETQQLTIWLNEYLDSYSPTPDINAAIRTKAPFLKDDAVYVHLDRVGEYIEMYLREKKTKLKIRIAMRALGAAPAIQGTTIDGRSTSRSYWKLTPEISARFFVQDARASQDLFERVLSRDS